MKAIKYQSRQTASVDGRSCVRSAVIRFSALALLIFGFTGVISAADLNITSEVSSKSIGLNEQLTLTISATGHGARLPGMKLPALSDFDVYSSGTSQNVSFVNGKISSVHENNYILVPKKTGKLTIPSFQITYKGKTYTTEVISVEVHQDSLTSAGGSSEKPRKESFWIEQRLDKKVCYTGEPVYYTFIFYADRGLRQNPALSLPPFHGFLKEDLPPPRRYNKVIGGKNYSVTEIKSVIFPVKKGAFSFVPARLEIVESSFPGGGNDFFSGFFRGGRRKILKTEPLRLEVRALPKKGRPDNYSGSVGKFSISGATDKKSLRVGEAVNLSVKITGEGNISSINEPDFPRLTNFKRYDIISSQQISKNNYKITGSKTFQVVLVPRVAGEQIIPGVESAYFDPSSGKYEKIRTKEIRLNVKKAAISASPGYENPPAAGSAAFKELGRDIRYIAPARCRGKKSNFVSSNFSILQIIPLLLFLIVTAVKHRIAERLIPAAALTRHRAFARASGVISNLPSHRGLLCGGVESALFNFVREKTNTEKNISVEHILKEKKVQGKLRAELASFVRKCQSERFSPAGAGMQPDEMKREALALLKKLKKHL
ncbi:MAG: BatD family protein [Elusimicrobiota bacterium]|nr:BatD family protein [Elusimicrobiota bacterium]